jgi:hypothetical protein
MFIIYIIGTGPIIKRSYLQGKWGNAKFYVETQEIRGCW